MCVTARWASPRWISCSPDLNPQASIHPRSCVSYPVRDSNGHIIAVGSTSFVFCSGSLILRRCSIERHPLVLSKSPNSAREHLIRNAYSLSLDRAIVSGLQSHHSVPNRSTSPGTHELVASHLSEKLTRAADARIITTRDAAGQLGTCEKRER